MEKYNKNNNICMDNTQIVGEKIKSIRETKQISVSELAERTGLAE